jgi:hypothetical protein
MTEDKKYRSHLLQPWLEATGERNGWFFPTKEIPPEVREKAPRDYGFYHAFTDHLTDEELSHLEDLFKAVKNKREAWEYIADNIGPMRWTITEKFADILEKNGLLLLDRDIIRHVVSRVTNTIILEAYRREYVRGYKGDNTRFDASQRFNAYGAEPQRTDALYHDVYMGHQLKPVAFASWINKRFGNELYEAAGVIYFGGRDGLTPISRKDKDIIAMCLSRTGWLNDDRTTNAKPNQLRALFNAMRAEGYLNEYKDPETREKQAFTITEARERFVHHVTRKYDANLSVETLKRVPPKGSDKESRKESDQRELFSTVIRELRAKKIHV